MDWLDLLSVQGTPKSLLQHISKASIPQHSAFFIDQLSHIYMTTGKTIALTRQTFVGKVISLLSNMLQQVAHKTSPLVTPHTPSPILGDRLRAGKTRTPGEELLALFTWTT